MTAPATPPALNEPLMTIEQLATWVQLPEIPEDRRPFAFMVMEGAAVVFRDAGSPWWVYPGASPLPAGHVVIPARAKLMYDLKVKNFFEHPTGAVSETVGPLSERYLDEVVKQLELSQGEKDLLASLADDDDPATGPSLQIWALSTYRGPLETHSAVRGVIHVPWWRPGSKALPYYAAGALGSPE
jgi:hypothetical protein